MKKMDASLKITLLLALLTACRTSSDVVRGKEYVDPTEVKTEGEASAESPRRENPAQEELGRQVAILQGENEALKVNHAREIAVLNSRILSLEVENKKLKDAFGEGQAAVDERPKTVDDLWLLALKNIEKQGYEKSAQNFDDLMKEYPKSPLVFYAHLGRAMSLYNSGEFKEAALVFNQIIDRYPKKREVSLAWFGQGSSFYKMGQRQDARLFFSEIASRFPKSDEAPVAKRILDKKRVPPPDLFVAFPAWAKYAPRP